ncbi:MAG: 2Fe-2S iron-sulfur cluster-binding protein [Pseudomonadota bacterium]
MTAYILNIDRPEEIYTIQVKRYNPEKDPNPVMVTYKIPFVKTMTVIEALEYLWDQGEYIAFRANCREFTCGSCAMLINGKPRLACNTLLENNMTVEPLSRYPVIKDLVVDTSRVKDKIKELKYWPVGNGKEEPFRVPKAVMDDYGKIYSRCIECGCCLEACPASSSEESKFDGPMHLLQVARAGKHPLDRMDRINQASERGIWSCVSCFECADVCPIDLSPGDEIAKFRNQAIRRNILHFFGIKRS